MTARTGGIVQSFYEDDHATLYHGDAREVLPLLSRGSADLLVTDPPYGQGYESNRRERSALFDVIAGDDGSLDVPATIALALRVLRHKRHVYIFGPVDLTPLPLAAVSTLIWDKGKMGMGDLTQPWGISHEYIQFATYIQSKAQQEAQGKLAARMRRGSIVRCMRTSGVGVVRHPTEKPVLLMRHLIESSSVLGETVLDPFAGAGSTLVASVISGRQAIGIELEERYCSIAAKRLSALVPIMTTLRTA